MDAPVTYIGTSGWSYPTGFGRWTGGFYPKRWRGDELAFYAERFPAVEVNTTFYRMVNAATVTGWRDRTPPTFQFTVKLFRKFTHPEFYAREEKLSPEITPDDVRTMQQALDPLAECGKLGALLVQYPEFFRNTPDNLSRLVATLDTFRAYPLAVELRHASCDDNQGHDILAHFRAARVGIDEPNYRNFTDARSPREAQVEYWRFHGRNAEGWRKPGAGSQRYDYLYTMGEIDEFAQALQQQAEGPVRRYVFFNNHPNSQAVANAVTLAARVGLDLPYRKFAHLTELFPDLTPITGGVGGQLRMMEKPGT